SKRDWSSALCSSDLVRRAVHFDHMRCGPPVVIDGSLVQSPRTAGGTGVAVDLDPVHDRQAVKVFHRAIAAGTDQMGAGDVDEFMGGNAQAGLFAELAHAGVGGRAAVLAPTTGRRAE